MEADKGRSGRLWMGYIAAALVDESRENPHALALEIRPRLQVDVSIRREGCIRNAHAPPLSAFGLLANRDALLDVVGTQGRRASRQSPQRRQMGAWSTTQMVKVSRGAMRRRGASQRKNTYLWLDVVCAHSAAAGGRLLHTCAEMRRMSVRCDLKRD